MVDYSPALMTDMYEYTMLDAALKDGTADRKCVFEVFTRHLPEGRRYGVVAGTGRILDALEHFHLDEADLKFLADRHVVSPRPLSGWRTSTFPVRFAVTAKVRCSSRTPRFCRSKARSANARYWRR